MSRWADSAASLSALAGCTVIAGPAAVQHLPPAVTSAQLDAAFGNVTHVVGTLSIQHNDYVFSLAFLRNLQFADVLAISHNPR